MKIEALFYSLLKPQHLDKYLSYSWLWYVKGKKERKQDVEEEKKVGKEEGLTASSHRTILSVIAQQMILQPTQ